MASKLNRQINRHINKNTNFKTFRTMIEIVKEVSRTLDVREKATAENVYGFNGNITVEGTRLTRISSMQVTKFNNGAIGNITGDGLTMPMLSVPVADLEGAGAAYASFLSRLKAKIAESAQEGGEA